MKRKSQKILKNVIKYEKIEKSTQHVKKYKNCVV